MSATKLKKLVEKHPTASNLVLIDLPDGEFMARFCLSPSATAPHVYGFGATPDIAAQDAADWFSG